jgi:hypothetical protein
MWYGDTGWSYYTPAPVPQTVYSPGYVYPDYYYSYPRSYYYPYGYGYYGYGYGPRVGTNVWGHGVRAGRWYW